MDSFLAYVSKDEKEVITAAVKCDLNEDQQEDWIDFLDRFGCRRIPKEEERKAVILEIAHKEMIQVAQYVTDSWRKPCKDLLKHPDFASGNSLEELYNKGKPTVKKVLNLLAAEPSNNLQRDALSYLKRYIRGLEEERMTKFFRYCTGATMICVEHIEVTFTDLDGSARRPVAHTCGPLLELPSTYQSFLQFREEMNNILSSEYWDIDFV